MAVELAAAVALRRAGNHVLAGAGPVGPVPDSLRWIRYARSAAAGTLGAHDPRTAGAIPTRHARTLARRGSHRPHGEHTRSLTVAYNGRTVDNLDQARRRT